MQEVSLPDSRLETSACANILLVLQDELETAMRLAGITDLNDVRGDMSWLNTAELMQYLPPRAITKGTGSWLSNLFRSKL